MRRRRDLSRGRDVFELVGGNMDDVGSRMGTLHEALGFPWLRHIFADGGYAGDKLKDALRRIGKWTIAIIKRSDAASGFEVLPRRWVVERALAWLNRNRHLEGLRADHRIGQRLAVPRLGPAPRSPRSKAR